MALEAAEAKEVRACAFTEPSLEWRPRTCLEGLGTYVCGGGRLGGG